MADAKDHININNTIVFNVGKNSSGETEQTDGTVISI